MLFVRDSEAWAVTPDGSETVGPLDLSGPVGCLAASRDGRYLAATDAEDGSFRVFRVRPGFDFVEVDRFRSGCAEFTSVEWSPNGRVLAVGTARRASGLTLGGRIKSPLEPSADDIRLGVGKVTEPSVWVFSWRAGDEDIEDGGAPERLGPLALPLAVASSVAWSADSTFVAFGRPMESSLGAICVADMAAGRTAVVELAERAYLGDLSWSPDGRSLTYSGWGGIYTVPADGSATESLLVTGEEDRFTSACWSPDGTRLAYERSWRVPRGQGSPSMSLWVLDARSGMEKCLTGEDMDLVSGSIGWSPDGTLVSFFGHPRLGDAQRPVPNTLYTADPESGAVTQVAGGFRIYGGLAAINPFVPVAWLVTEASPAENASVGTGTKDQG